MRWAFSEFLAGRIRRGSAIVVALAGETETSLVPGRVQRAIVGERRGNDRRARGSGIKQLEGLKMVLVDLAVSDCLAYRLAA